MGSKTFKNLDEQIELLRQKGLVIDDVDYAKEVLLRENYFFLMGYRHPFLRSDGSRKFIRGTNFRELYGLFNFDRQLRNILFKNILIVENNLKSILSYVMSKNHGFKEQSYLNASNFVQDRTRNRQINDLLRKMKRQISVNGKQHQATAHYIKNYGYIPLWVVVKVLSFGIVGELYSVLQKEDQEEIADAYKVPVTSLIMYLPILANYRNLCAHEDLCFNNRINKRINNTKYHDILNIPKDEFDEYVYGINDLFAIVIIMKQILKEEDFILMMNEISYELDILDGKLETIEIDDILDIMGLPLNYKEIVRMN
jgi:abortive infection bacteriophage resistance protein